LHTNNYSKVITNSTWSQTVITIIIGIWQTPANKFLKTYTRFDKFEALEADIKKAYHSRGNE